MCVLFLTKDETLCSWLMHFLFTEKNCIKGKFGQVKRYCDFEHNNGQKLRGLSKNCVKQNRAKPRKKFILELFFSEA